MQQRAIFHRHRSCLVCLVLAASACAAESSDEDTGAATETGSASDTTPTTTPSTMSATDPDDGGTDPTDTTPSDESTSAPDPTSGGEAESEGDSSGDGGTTGAAGSTVFGTVSRSAAAAIAAGNDGIGTFYLGVLVECTQDAASVAGNGVEVDVSAQDTPVVWEVGGVPDGHYYIAGFLDDNGNADPNDPYADMGDLAAAAGLGPACLEITVAGDEVAAGQIVLNIAVPF